MCGHGRGHCERDLQQAMDTARSRVHSGQPVFAGAGPAAAPDPDLLIADRDRERVIDALKQATADGRLTIDEFSDRVEETYRARTAADLRQVLRQMPASIADVAMPPPPPPAWPGSAPACSSRASAIRW